MERQKKRMLNSNEEDEPCEKRKLRGNTRRDYAEMERLELKDPLTLLKKKNNSSDMKAEWVHYVLHVAFKAMGKGVCLLDASVEECLLHMFNFVSEDVNDTMDILVARDIKLKRLRFIPCMKWLMDHDVLDWKNCSEKEKSDALHYFSNEVDKVGKDCEGAATNLNAAIFIKSVLRSYSKIDKCAQNDKEGYIRASVKHNFITSYIEALGSFINSDYLRNGHAEVELPLCIKRTDVEVEDIHVKIITKPDGVFVHDKNDLHCWRMVVEIYGPGQESSLAMQKVPTAENRHSLPGWHRKSRSRSPSRGTRTTPSPQVVEDMNIVGRDNRPHYSIQNKNRRGSHSHFYQNTPVFSPHNLASTSSSSSDISSLVQQSETPISEGFASYGQRTVSNANSVPLNFSAYVSDFGFFTGQSTSNAGISPLPLNCPASDSGYVSGQLRSSTTNKQYSESLNFGVNPGFNDVKIAPRDSGNIDPYYIELVKPARTRKGIIVDQNYKSQARRYIENSLPHQCCEHHCVDKMAGQHVIQLFCEAMVNMTFSRKNSQKAIGMFVVNEYIYFSRLDVENAQLKLILGTNYIYSGYYNVRDLEDKLDEQFLQGKEPVVQYSNFRLDITKPNHRMALIMFLSKYIYLDE